MRSGWIPGSVPAPSSTPHSPSGPCSRPGSSSFRTEPAMAENEDRSPVTPRPRIRAALGRVVGIVIVVAAIALAAYAVYYLDTSPRTDDAFAQADTIGVAAQVSGRIQSLRVQDNQAVKQGDVLFEIDPRPYRYALDRSRSALDALEKQIGLQQRDVNAQQFGAVAARTNIARAQAQAKQAADTLDRLEPLLKQEYVTPEQVDQARTAKRSADAAVEVARSDAQRAAAGVGSTDAMVARLGELRAAVALAEYDLEQTVVRAPFDGTVVDLNIAVGAFAATG